MKIKLDGSHVLKAAFFESIKTFKLQPNNNLKFSDPNHQLIPISLDPFLPTKIFFKSSQNFTKKNIINLKSRLRKSDKNSNFSINQDYFKFFIDNAPDCIFIQTNWKFSYLNKNALELFGASSSVELIGQPILDRIHPDFKERVTSRIKGLNEKKQIQQLQELVFLKLDGTEVNVETSGIPFTYHDSIGALVFVRDISDRKKLQETITMALKKSEAINTLKTNFLQNLSHEIRTPLNAIQGFSELLGVPGLALEKQKEFIENIRKSINELSDLISKSVTMSLLDSKLEVINLSLTSLELILDDLYGRFSSHSKINEIELILKNPNPNLKFQADHEKVYLVLFNLVENAFKFTESGMIEFGYRLEDDFLVFFVKDTGPGISEEFNDLIFERFYQIEDPTSKSYPGLGLGLSISKSLTELMGGKIWILSEIGKGSEFCFSIPMDRPE